MALKAKYGCRAFQIIIICVTRVLQVDYEHVCVHDLDDTARLVMKRFPVQGIIDYEGGIMYESCGHHRLLSAY